MKHQWQVRDGVHVLINDNDGKTVVAYIGSKSGEYAGKVSRPIRDVSADIWTGVRETIKRTDQLFGQKLKGSAITGESTSYADQFDSLVRDKARHLGISVKEMERRPRKGDATLLSAVLAMPLGLAASPQDC